MNNPFSEDVKCWRNMLRIWIIITIGFISALACWAIFGLTDVKNQISVISIIAVVITAITSVSTVVLNNSKTKEREIEIIILKEKQKVFEHFYNAWFEIMKNVKSKKAKVVTDKVENEMMAFKRGLMNWGSENLIKEYLHYETKISDQKNSIDTVKNADGFLKCMRREMGFKDSGRVNIMSVVLTSESREDIKL